MVDWLSKRVWWCMSYLSKWHFRRSKLSWCVKNVRETDFNQSFFFLFKNFAHNFQLFRLHYIKIFCLCSFFFNAFILPIPSSISFCCTPVLLREGSLDVVLNNKVLEADNSTEILLRINLILTRQPMHHQLQNCIEFLSWSHDRHNTKKHLQFLW